MKNILVTGAGGFIGSHLVEHLLGEGYNVRAFIRYNSKNYWGWLDNNKCNGQIDIYTGDIRDFDSVYRGLQGCDTVFHLAALIGIPYSYISPLAYIRTNIEGTYNILQAARDLSIQNIIITSTSETYGTAQYVPIDELHPLVGQSPYSASKIAADQLALSYYRSFGLPVKIARPFNVYGPRQSGRAIIPTIISQLLSGKAKLNLGNLSPTRDLNYVRDAVAGFVAISKNDALNGQIVNIGSGLEISIFDLVNLISELLQLPIEIESVASRIRPFKSEVERLLCDNRKLIDNTSWQPQYSLRDGLLETIGWLRNNLTFYKPEIYNV